MKIKTTVVYKVTEQAYKDKCSIVVHQGGSRSSKTYNILIWLIVKALTEWENEIIDIGRKTFPSLRASVMLDFFTILKENNLYDVNQHNKSEYVYKIRNNTFRFFSIDQETKIRGSKRSYLFMNEANEFNYDDFKQMNMRTSKMTILDYNPSDEFHWIYDNIIPREDTKFFKTTFRDNPFLDARIRKEIMAYKNTDPNYWRIYGLGEKGVSETTIFPVWDYWDVDWNFTEGQEFYGLDFGFNDPTVLVRTKYHKEHIVFDELFYKTNLTSDLIVLELKKLVEMNKLKYDSTIYADCARPEIIEDIKRAGFNIFPVEKGKFSVLRDINFMKRHKIYLTKESVDGIKEIKSYKWKVDKSDKVLDTPVDLNDHFMDAGRYSLCMVVNYLDKDTDLGVY